MQRRAGDLPIAAARFVDNVVAVDSLLHHQLGRCKLPAARIGGLTSRSHRGSAFRSATACRGGPAAVPFGISSRVRASRQIARARLQPSRANNRHMSKIGMAVVTMKQLLDSGNLHFASGPVAGTQDEAFHLHRPQRHLHHRPAADVDLIDKAYEFVKRPSLTVGRCSSSAQEAVSRYAGHLAGMPYVNQRWLGGMSPTSPLCMLHQGA